MVVLAVFVLFQGEFWSVKFILTRNFFQAFFDSLVSLRSMLFDFEGLVYLNKERRPKRDQKFETNEVSYWTVYNYFNFSV